MSQNGNGANGSVPRLKTRYHQEVLPALMKEFGYQNTMQAPRFVKIAVNIGLGEALQNSKAIEADRKSVV